MTHQSPRKQGQTHNLTSFLSPFYRVFNTRSYSSHHQDDFSDYDLYLSHQHGSSSTVPYPLVQACCHQALALLKATHINLANIQETNVIEELLQANAIRYRRVDAEADYSKFDFGVMIGLSCNQSSDSVDVLSRFQSNLYIFNISQGSDDKTTSQISCNKYNALNAPKNYDYFLEIYAPLPYKVGSISQFLRFIFTEFEQDTLFVLLFSLLGSTLQLLFPSITVYVTSTVVSLGSSPLAFQVGFLALMLALASVSSLFVQSLFVTKLETESDKRAQTAVWDRLLKLELSEIAKYTSSDLMLRAASVSQVRTLLSSSNIASLVNLLTSFAFIFVMYTYIPSALLAILPLILLYVFIVIRVSLLGGRLLTKSLDASAQLSSEILQLLTCLPEIRVLNTYRFWERRIVRQLKLSQELSYRFRKRDNSIDILSRSFQSLAFCVSLAVILRDLASTDHDLQEYVYQILGYTSALTLFSANLSSGTFTIANSVVQVLAYWKRSEPLIFSPIESGYDPSCSDINYTGQLSFESVSFSYSPDSPSVFTDLTFSVDQSDVALLRIPPGRGSSTLFKLALGIYPTVSGHILFDGHHIDTLNIIGLRKHISLAPQSPYVPMGPLGDLFAGPLCSTDEDLALFLESFQLTQLVQSLRMGLNTPVPPGGSCFSNEQRQLLSLAKAVSRKPRLLLIDNSISSLPLATVSSIFDYLSSQDITILASSSDENIDSLFRTTIDIS
mgnify:CR=1 FL=1